MSEGIRCVTIVHKADEIKRYRKMSGYFRLIGIFVCEILEGREDYDPTDFKIWLLDDDSPQSVKEALEQMKEILGSAVVATLNQISDIYDKYQLMEGSYAIEYFADSKEKLIYEDMDQAHGRFKRSLQEFLELEKKDEVAENPLSMKYILTAQANCLRRMNQLFTVQWEAIRKKWYTGSDKATKSYLHTKGYYSHKELVEKINRILKIDSEFYGAYAIKAFFELLDDKTKVDSMESFNSALRLLNGRSYSSYLLYRMGRYYEYILIRPRKSRDNYQKAYKVDPDNYRAAFKLSVFALNEREYDEALWYLDKIIEILGCKKDLNTLQPVECAYLFKAYRNKGRIYFQFGNYMESITFFENAITVYNNEENDKPDGFYPFMFKDNAIVYKRAARSKLHVWKVYENLAEAWARAGSYEKYKKYHLEAESLRER